jgi:carbon storage regulator CsrA
MPGMLVLQRAIDERVVISVAGKTIEIVVCDVQPNGARLGFTAPDDVKILRKELIGRDERDQRRARFEKGGSGAVHLRRRG